MNKIGKTYVSLILDSSASMAIIRKEAIDMFNAQIKALIKESKKAEAETEVSLFTFSNKYKTIHDSVNVSKITLLEDEDYLPSGTTALYDTIAFAVEKQIKTHKLKESDAVLFIIITDGEENASEKHGGVNGLYYIKGLLDAVEFTDQWTITFMGTEDALSEAKLLSLRSSNTFSFASNTDSINTASESASRGITRYYTSRVLGETKVDGFFVDTDDTK